MDPPPPPVQSLAIDKMTCDMSMLYQDPETSNISSTASVRSDKTDDVDDRQESVDESEEDGTPPDSPPLWWNSIMEKTWLQVWASHLNRTKDGLDGYGTDFMPTTTMILHQDIWHDGYGHLYCAKWLWDVDVRYMYIIHGPLSKRRGSEKKAYLCEMKAWLGAIVDICTSMCAYNMCYSGKLS